MSRNNPSFSISGGNFESFFKDPKKHPVFERVHELMSQGNDIVVTLNENGTLKKVIVKKSFWNRSSMEIIRNATGANKKGDLKSEASLLASTFLVSEGLVVFFGGI